MASIDKFNDHWRPREAAPAPARRLCTASLTEGQRAGRCSGQTGGRGEGQIAPLQLLCSLYLRNTVRDTALGATVIRPNFDNSPFSLPIGTRRQVAQDRLPPDRLSPAERVPAPRILALTTRHRPQ